MTLTYILIYLICYDILYMSGKRHIVGVSNKKTHKMDGQKMLEIIMIGSFVLLGAYSIWYFFKAKTYHPLGLQELALMWKTHKHTSGCNASTIDTLLLKNNEVVGYKCSCGTKYYQKRLITQRAHTFTKNKLMPNITSRFTSVSELTRSMDQLGLNYSNIKRV